MGLLDYLFEERGSRQAEADSIAQAKALRSIAASLEKLAGCVDQSTELGDKLIIRIAGDGEA